MHARWGLFFTGRNFHSHYTTRASIEKSHHYRDTVSICVHSDFTPSGNRPVVSPWMRSRIRIYDISHSIRLRRSFSVLVIWLSAEAQTIFTSPHICALAITASGKKAVHGQCGTNIGVLQHPGMLIRSRRGSEDDGTFKTCNNSYKQTCE
jgi:hypothetical protein